MGFVVSQLANDVTNGTVSSAKRSAARTAPVRSIPEPIEKSYRVLAGGVRFAGYSGHHTVAPAGMLVAVLGGRRSSRCAVAGGEFALSPLAVALLEEGGVLTIRTAGGGGFGRAEEPCA